MRTVNADEVLNLHSEDLKIEICALDLNNRIKNLITISQKCYRITESQNSRGWKGPLWVI